MEGSASAPTHPLIELEPPEWQPRALRAGARGLCGAVAFFMLSFVFAYFYLRAQDPNKGWKIGHVKPSLALGLIILLVLVASAVAMRVAASRPELTVSAGAAALALALLSVVLQVIEWTTLGFGPASGGYASVFVGWTAVLLGPHRRVRVLDRDAGGDRLAPATRRGLWPLRLRSCPTRRSWRRASRPARSSGRSMSPTASCCSCCSTCSRR